MARTSANLDLSGSLHAITSDGGILRGNSPGQRRNSPMAGVCPAEPFSNIATSAWNATGWHHYHTRPYATTALAPEGALVWLALKRVVSSKRNASLEKEMLLPIFHARTERVGILGEKGFPVRISL